MAMCTVLGSGLWLMRTLCALSSAPACCRSHGACPGSVGAAFLHLPFPLFSWTAVCHCIVCLPMQYHPCMTQAGTHVGAGSACMRACMH